MSKNIHLPKTIPKQVLRTRSRCRRKLYRMIGITEYNFLQYSNCYNNQQIRLIKRHIKQAVYSYYAFQLDWSIKRIKFKYLSNCHCMQLEKQIDITDIKLLFDYVEIKLKNILHGV